MEFQKCENLAMDFQSLISCIQCHTESKNVPVIIETLKTIIDICTINECGKDAFREVGGLEFLMELLSTTNSTVLLEHLLKTIALAIDENVYSQRIMSQKEFFATLQTVLKKSTFPASVIKNALLLISSILFQNSSAQALISENLFLENVISLYENAAAPFLSSSRFNSLNESTDIFISANSVLCFAVNNPQNEKNQDICSTLFPLSLKLLEFSSDYMITSAVSSFMSLCVADNAKNKAKFVDNDGLMILKRSFQKHFDSIELDMKEFNSLVAKCTLQSMNNLIGIISAIVIENDKNAALLGKLGVLSLMIKLLFSEVPNDQLQTRIMLALAYCIDAHSDCKSFLMQFDNFENYLKKNFLKEDVELVSASKYLLQVCLNGKEILPESDINLTQDDQSIFTSVSDRCSVKTKCKDIFKNASARKKVHVNSFKKPPVQSTKPPSIELFRKHSSRKSHIQSLELKNDRKCSLKSGVNLSPYVSQPQQSFCINEKKEISQNHTDKHSDSFSQSFSRNNYKNSKQENITVLNNISMNKSNSINSIRENDNFFEFRDKQPLRLSSKTVAPSEVSHLSFKHKEKLDGGFNLNFKQLDHFSNIFKKQNLKDNFETIPENFSEVLTEFKPVLFDKTNHEPLTSKKTIRDERNSNFTSKNTEYASTENDTSNKITMYNNSIHSSNPHHALENVQENMSISGKNKLRERTNLLFDEVDDRDSSQDSYISSNNFLKDFKTCASASNGTGGLFKFNHTENLKDFVNENIYCTNKKRKPPSKRKRCSELENELLSPETNLESLQVCSPENYIQVIVLPGVTCEQHELISSFEMLKVSSLEKAILNNI